MFPQCEICIKGRSLAVGQLNSTSAQVISTGKGKLTFMDIWGEFFDFVLINWRDEYLPKMQYNLEREWTPQRANTLVISPNDPGGKDYGLYSCFSFVLLFFLYVCIFMF